MSGSDDQISDDELEAARADREGLEWLVEDQRSGNETVQPTGQPSKRPISDTAFDLIVEFEVSNQQLYERKYRGPVWPQGASGVTIGIGYDIGYATESELRADFGEAIPEAMIQALKPALGVTGRPAETLARRLAGTVDIPWKAAIAVHRTKVIPRWIGVTERALPNTGSLGPDSLGALVSLTYNRGASFSKAGDRYREMRDIKTHLGAAAFDRVPGDIRAMKHLWPTVPGLQKRREREASLFEAGLAAV